MTNKKTRHIDITGKIFGRLTAIKRIPNLTKNRKARWECICTCGNTCNVYYASLNYGKTKSCGCLNNEVRGYTKDLTGRIFGRLTVIKRAGRRGANNKITWLCRCSCGNEKEIPGISLTQGTTSSCGCLAKDTNKIVKEDLTGKSFANGRLVVLSRAENLGYKKDKTAWLCRCHCGNEKVIRGDALKGGTRRSCGCAIKERKFPLTYDMAKKQREKRSSKAYLRKIKKLYGMSDHEYEVLLQKQNGLCCICKEKSNKKLAIDHNHKTGKVRGLLCFSCNSAIGLLKENINYFNNAIAYLENNNEQL